MTKYGWPQIVFFPLIMLAVMAVFLTAGISFLPLWVIISVEVVLVVFLLWTLAFFRDPHRIVVPDKNLLLAPADGKITDIELVENEFIGGRATRIGIFLNIFDVHINRAPCDVKVKNISYKKGKYKNAMNPQSGRVNESNELQLIRTCEPQDKLIVRQISGAIARRIVCNVYFKQELTGGEKFGMIKFGSRTELYLPAREGTTCLVKVGNKVKAGLTPLVRYERCQD